MTESQQNIEDNDRWMCARHGALKIEQTYKLAFIRTPRKTRRCKKCLEPVAYMSQAEAADLAPADINATLRRGEEILPSDFVREDRYFVVKREDVKTTLSNAEKVSLNYLLGKIEIGRKKRGKEKRAYVVVADHWPMYEQVWAMVKEYADKQAKRAWKPLDDEAPACSKCNRAPFQYRLDGAEITYGCKCGHEWEAGQ